jgi:molecular chaperone GrpE
MKRAVDRVDFTREQYYTAPIGGTDWQRREAGEPRESLFSIKAELARLSLHIERLGKEEERLAAEVRNAAEGSVALRAEVEAKSNEIQSRLDSLRALFATRLASILPAIKDAASNLDESLKSELAALARLVESRAPSDGQGMSLAPDFAGQLNRIESSLALKDRIETEAIQKREILDMIAVVDSFDRLLSFLESSGESPSESWAVGVKSIHKLLLELLAKRGVKPIEELDKFDPHIHQAIGTVDSPDLPEGAIAKVLLRGFLVKGKVLRCAEVVVVRRKGVGS